MKLHTLLKPIHSAANLIAKPFGYVFVTKASQVDFYLHEYASYEEYRDIQIKHNKRKLHQIWADEATLTRVGELVSKTSRAKNIKGICHGTRNGFEQNFLNTHFPNIKAIGTDISETAAQFENSVQWDFHETNKDWVNKFDFVYSNSLDQSWKPRSALTAWLNQVKKGGCVIIEHTKTHGPTQASEMDPFGVRPIAMPYVLSDWFGDQISISHSKEKKANKDIDAWLFVCRKLVDEVV